MIKHCYRVSIGRPADLLWYVNRRCNTPRCNPTTAACCMHCAPLVFHYLGTRICGVAEQYFQRYQWNVLHAIALLLRRTLAAQCTRELVATRYNKQHSRMRSKLLCYCSNTGSSFRIRLLQNNRYLHAFRHHVCTCSKGYGWSFHQSKRCTNRSQTNRMHALRLGSACSYIAIDHSTLRDCASFPGPMCRCIEHCPAS